MNRYLIFGAGAVGALLGGLLAKDGNPVIFVGRKWNVDAIRQKGIQISGIWGEHQTGPQSAYESIDDIPNDCRNFDIVLFTVKAFDTQEAIRKCLPVIHDRTVVVSCQNGYGNSQIIAEQIGWERTLGARVITGVELTQPGIVSVTVHADAIRLGHYANQIPMDRLESIAQPLQKAGVLIEATDRLEQYIWAKILYNAALNPLGAMLGVTYGDLANNPATRSVMDKIIEEAFAVTDRCGIQHFWPTAKAYKESFYNQMIPPTAAHFPSMLRDLQKGRRTEIGALNGAVCRLGKEKQVPTPVNDTITSLMNFREKNL